MPILRLSPVVESAEILLRWQLNNAETYNLGPKWPDWRRKNSTERAVSDLQRICGLGAEKRPTARRVDRRMGRGKPAHRENAPSRANTQPLAKLLGQEFARTLLRAGRWPLRNRGCRLVNERQSGTELIEDAAKKNGGAEAPPLDCIAQGPRWGHGPARSG